MSQPKSLFQKFKERFKLLMFIAPALPAAYYGAVLAPLVIPAAIPGVNVIYVGAVIGFILGILAAALAEKGINWVKENAPKAVRKLRGIEEPEKPLNKDEKIDLLINENKGLKEKIQKLEQDSTEIKDSLKQLLEALTEIKPAKIQELFHIALKSINLNPAAQYNPVLKPGPRSSSFNLRQNDNVTLGNVQELPDPSSLPPPVPYNPDSSSNNSIPTNTK